MKSSLTVAGAALVAAVSCGLAIGVATATSPLLLALAAATAVTGVVAIKRPGAFTWLAIGLIYGNVAVVGVTVHGLPTYTSFAVPLLLIVPFAFNLFEGRPIVLPPAAGWLMLFTAAQIISTIVSADTIGSWSVFQTYLVEGLGIYVAVYNVIVSRRSLVMAVQVVVGVAAALAALSVFQWVTRTYGQDYFGFAQVSQALIKVDAAGEQTQPRIAGPVGEKNRYGQVLAIVAPLALALVWNAQHRYQRVIWSGAFALIITGVALTYSRGAALGLASVLLVALFLRGVRLWQVAAMVVAVAVVVLAVPGYRERLASLEAISGATAAPGEQGETDGAIRGRATQNIAAFQMFRDHPIFGVGPGMYAVYYPQYEADIGIRQKFGSVEAHNLPLGIAADLGLVGLVAFYGLTFALARRLWHLHRRGDPLATGFLLFLLAYQTTGMFLHLAYIRYFWLLMALAAATVTTASTWASEREPDRELQLAS